MIRSIYRIFLFFISTLGFAQNLIQNPGFELRGPEPPLMLLNGDHNFTCDNWVSPTVGTPDYYLKGRGGNFGSPKTWAGNLEPCSGRAFAGFFLFHQPTTDFEYIQIKLKEPLIKDKSYFLSIFVSAGSSQESHFSTNEIHYCLTKDEISQVTVSAFKVDSYERIFLQNGCFEPGKWIQLTSFYKAKGEEEFLTIGGFDKDFKKCALRNFSGTFDSVYIFVDDISLVPNSK